MSVDRLERVNALIRREIAEALFTTITDTRFDRASVTVTHVNTSRNLRNARVRVSVRGSEDHQEETLRLLRRFRHEIQKAINRDLTLKYTPVLQFDLDPSLAKGDHVLDLLAHLETPSEEENHPAEDSDHRPS